MANTNNATAANANYLASKTGMSPSAAYAWLLAEQQAVPNPTNPLNIIKGGTPGQTGGSVGQAGQYPSTTAGLDAAAWLIKNGNYPGIRAAITTGNPVTQTKAIDASSWGTSAAYSALAAAEKAMISVPQSSTPTITDAVKGTVSWVLGIGKGSPGYTGSGSGAQPFTQSMLDTIVGDIPVDNPNRDTIIAGLTSQLGQPANTVKIPANWTDTPTGGWQNFWGGQAGTNGSGGGVGNSGIGAPGSLLDFSKVPPAIALIFGGIMAIFGVYLIYKDTSSNSTNTVVQQRTIPIVYRGAQ